MLTTQNEHQTRELGREIGKRMVAGTVIALNGNLGTGKTRLTQGIGLGLDVPPDSIVSPTYTLCVPYEGRLRLLHVDAYRIQDASEVDEFGLDEQIEDGAVLIVEWADRILQCLPPVDLEIRIESGKSDNPRPTSDEIREFRFFSPSGNVDVAALLDIQNGSNYDLKQTPQP